MNLLSLFSSRDGESPLIVAPCTVPGHSLWFGRAEIFEDKIVVRGWKLSGFYRRHIPIEEIESAQWLPREDYNILLRMKDDGRRLLGIKKRSGSWYWTLKGLIDTPDAFASHPFSTPSP